MFRLLALSGALMMAVSACGDAAAAGAASQLQPAFVPRGATLGPNGHATILDVPPAPFTPAPPGAPPPPSAAQIADQEQFRRVGEFQNQVMDEVHALQRKLKRLEKGNFVDLYFENEGESHVVFRFLREPERTLARYTKHPRFRAARADYTQAQLAAALEFMMDTFRDERVVMGGGYGNKENRATVEIAIPEEEFRKLVAAKGVTIPDAVKLEFRATTPARQVNGPLPPAIAPLVRIFPRDDRPLGAVHSINSYAKVVLKDGCFRSPDNGNSLVLFPLGAQLFVDSEDYLAFGSQETPGYARVGEEIVFMGSIGEVTAPELVGPIHAACGTGKVIKVNALRSAAADRARSRASDNANALRQFRESYGLSEAAAQTALERCKAQMGFGACNLTPPPPVARQEDCPPGTKLAFGLCRTPEGYTRPVPEWVKDLVGI